MMRIEEGRGMEKRKSMKCRPAAESRGSSLRGNHIVVEKKEVSNEKKNHCPVFGFPDAVCAHGMRTHLESVAA